MSVKAFLKSYNNRANLSLGNVGLSPCLQVSHFSIALHGYNTASKTQYLFLLQSAARLNRGILCGSAVAAVLSLFGVNTLLWCANRRNRACVVGCAH